MKTLIKLTLVLCLFGSVAFAGDMPGGNRSCPPEGCPPPPPPACSENCGGITGVLLDGGTDIVSDTIVAGTGLAIDFVNDTLGLF